MSSRVRYPGVELGEARLVVEQDQVQRPVGVGSLRGTGAYRWGGWLKGLQRPGAPGVVITGGHESEVPLRNRGQDMTVRMMEIIMVERLALPGGENAHR